MIEKILNKIHEEQDGLMDANGNFVSAKNEGAYHTLCDLEAYVESLAKESVSEDLKDAAQQYAKYTAAPPSDVAYHFVSGAYWMKNQLMKEAIDGVVICDEKLTHGYRDIVFKFPEELKVGDKVKLIIIKEEEK